MRFKSRISWAQRSKFLGTKNPVVSKECLVVSWLPTSVLPPDPEVCYRQVSDMSTVLLPWSLFYPSVFEFGVTPSSAQGLILTEEIFLAGYRRSNGIMGGWTQQLPCSFCSSLSLLSMSQEATDCGLKERNLSLLSFPSSIAESVTSLLWQVLSCLEKLLPSLLHFGETSPGQRKGLIPINRLSP